MLIVRHQLRKLIFLQLKPEARVQDFGEDRSVAASERGDASATSEVA